MTSERPDGRPARSTFDHAPTVTSGDVDKCFECGRYAPHAFDHNPDCHRFEPTDAPDNVTPSAADNPRMVRYATDGGKARRPRPFTQPDQSPERVASEVVAASKGDRVVIRTGNDDTVFVYDGTVTSSQVKDTDDKRTYTHAVGVNIKASPERRVAVHFDRTIDFDAGGNLRDDDPVLFDPVEGTQTTVTCFDVLDDHYD